MFVVIGCRGRRKLIVYAELDLRAQKSAAITIVSVGQLRSNVQNGVIGQDQKKKVRGLF